MTTAVVLMAVLASGGTWAALVDFDDIPYVGYTRDLLISDNYADLGLVFSEVRNDPDGDGVFTDSGYGYYWPWGSTALNALYGQHETYDYEITLWFVDPANPADAAWAVTYLAMTFLDVDQADSTYWEAYDGTSSTPVGSGYVDNVPYERVVISDFLPEGTAISYVVLHLGTPSDGVGVDDIEFSGLHGLPQMVDIDIKPGSYPNSINLGSNGVVPVAILSTPEFDATTVDPETVALAGAGVAVRGKGNKYLSHAEDVDGDGDVDLLVQVETENLDPGEFQDGGAVLMGETYSGRVIVGWDEISIVPPA